MFQIGWKKLICHYRFVTRSKIYPFLIYMACEGMIFIKKFQILEKKNSFYFTTFNFLMLLLLHKTLKGSRNIQGFALIPAVLLYIKIWRCAWLHACRLICYAAISVIKNEFLFFICATKSQWCVPLLNE